MVLEYISTHAMAHVPPQEALGLVHVPPTVKFLNNRLSKRYSHGLNIMSVRYKAYSFDGLSHRHEFYDGFSVESFANRSTTTCNTVWNI